jgi:hypothetical protein
MLTDLLTRLPEKHETPYGIVDDARYPLLLRAVMEILRDGRHGSRVPHNPEAAGLILPSLSGKRLGE